MQYYTFQTINKFKSHFSNIEKQIKLLKNGNESNEDNNENTEDSAKNDNSDINLLEIANKSMNEDKHNYLKKDLYSKKIEKMPRFKESTFEEDDLFFQKVEKKLKSGKDINP